MDREPLTSENGETFRPLTTEERERYERWMDIMLADPNTDPWDIARCQQALDGKG